MRGSAPKLKKHYLSNRTRSVSANDTKIASLEINNRVPQGTIMGSPLFIFT